MTLKKQMKRNLGKRTTRQIYSAMPWVGGMLALAAATLVRKRGVRGAVEELRDVLYSVRANAKRPASQAAERA